MRGAWGVHVSEDGVGGSSRPLLDVVVRGLPSGNEAVVAVPNLGTLLGPRGQAGEVDTFITVLADYQVLLQHIKHICICYTSLFGTQPCISNLSIFNRYTLHFPITLI